MDIIAALAEYGIDKERLGKVIDGEYWGGLVHAFEVLTVLGVVHEAMKEASDADQ